MNESVAHCIEFEWVDRVDNAAELNPETQSLLAEAAEYLSTFDWVIEIKTAYVGKSIPGIIGIFLFQIEPRLVGVDDFVWVIVGDIPSAYITVEDCSNPACALDGYIGAMENWADAVMQGQPVDKLIPVDAAATIDNATALKRRLEFLDSRILPECRGVLHKPIKH